MMTKKERGELAVLLSQVTKSKKSDFYKKKYQKSKVKDFTLQKDSDFEKIPFLTREEIVGTDPFDRLYVAKEDVISFNLSSGTTSAGNPMLIPMVKWEDVTFKEIAKRFKTLHIQRVMVLANIAYSGARATDWLLDQKLQKYPYIMGDINNLQLSAWIGAKMQVEGIETNPSTLFYFMPYLKEVYDLSKIKYISMGGEYVTNQRYAFYKQYFKKAYFDFRFGGAENQVLKGFRCDFMSLKEPRIFHPTSEYYYFEVIDPVNGKVLADGAEGELVETSKQVSPFPLIRYRSGDMVTLDRNYHCLCGRKGKIEVLGRARNDSIKLYGVSLHVEMIEKALAKIKGINQLQYQLHIYEVIEKNQLKPRLVLQVLGDTKTKVKEKLLALEIQKNLFVSPKLTLDDLVAQQVFTPLVVEILKEWPFKYKYVKIVPHLD